MGFLKSFFASLCAKKSSNIDVFFFSNIIGIWDFVVWISPRGEKRNTQSTNPNRQQKTPRPKLPPHCWNKWGNPKGFGQQLGSKDPKVDVRMNDKKKLMYKCVAGWFMIYIPGTQMSIVLIGKGLLLEGWSPKTGDKQVPGIYIYIFQSRLVTY